MPLFFSDRIPKLSKERRSMMVDFRKALLVLAVLVFLAGIFSA